MFKLWNFHGMHSVHSRSVFHARLEPTFGHNPQAIVDHLTIMILSNGSSPPLLTKADDATMDIHGLIIINTAGIYVLVDK